VKFRTILVFLSSALSKDREKTALFMETNVRANSIDAFVSEGSFAIWPIRNHQLISFTPKDEQINTAHEVRIIFKCFVTTTNCFGVVAAATQGNVDCVDCISHFRLGLSGVVFERKSNNFELHVIATRRFGASGWKRPSPMVLAFAGREQPVPSPSSPTCNSTVESSFIFSDSGIAKVAFCLVCRVTGN
jgi:hypothetical protein